jgi:hypothetical protein
LGEIVAVDRAFERDPSRANHDFDPIEGHISALLERLDDRAGDVGIRVLAQPDAALRIDTAQ